MHRYSETEEVVILVEMAERARAIREDVNEDDCGCGDGSMVKLEDSNKSVWLICSIAEVFIDVDAL